MSETRSRAGSSQNRTDTMIGAGVRVEGDIVFTGVLRIQGDVLGNVACQGDAGDTVVVDATGSVTGAVGAPRIVVRGRVLGPLHSAQSIDIQQGGSVVGDAFYKEIVIHAGGVVEGALMPALPIDAAGEVHAGSTRQAAAPELPPPAANATPDAGGESFVARFGGWGALGGAAMLAIAVAAGVWMSRPPAKPAPRAADAAAPLSASPAAEPAASPAPAATADARAPAQPSPPEAGAEETVAVHGVNPAKPAGAFLLIGREPAVLYRKKRGEAGEGTRFVVQQGRTISVAIGRNELFRVAEGRDLDIFYQGRKVTPKTIESGAWMSFVPQGARAAGEDRQEETEDGPAR
ncbi:MAG: polymer-forming cytoskeletal protein [Zoogloeaceae bacterium]|nr:polymer-forming cytoskeletal protein [Zoogloeaceae bacterium]MCK6385908.1 polymer-forming cytoskeletal protein [Rhodocyclaceae bacterium]